MPNAPLLAVDIGNARIKIGLFRGLSGEALPEPERILPLEGDRPPFEQIETWLAECLPPISSESLSWYIASVNRPGATRLIDWLGRHRPEDRVTLLSAADLPLDVRLERPDMVGIDRLVDAVAVNRLRNSGAPAAIVDVGSAITVDLVSRDGAFLGGSILPGLAMSARAMHEFTDLLPLIETADLYEPPPALGTCTEEAMRSGLFWGAVGAIRQLIDELSRHTDQPLGATGVSPVLSNCPDSVEPKNSKHGQDARATPSHGSDACGAQTQVFLTGGAGVAVARLLGPNALYVPHLTLAGIALSAAGNESSLW
jgi:type III pantothenate kinase